MLYARDKRLGTDVPASQAKRYGAYICPTCKEDVMLRAGAIRVRHFAHLSGRQDRECDRYYPSAAIANPLTAPSKAAPYVPVPHVHIDRLALGLRVESATNVSRGDTRRWRLVLTLPKAPSSIGRLRLPIGKVSRDIRLHELAYAAKDFEVSPNLHRFGPEWVSDEVDYDYKEVVSNRLDRLEKTRAHAFAVTGGQTKPLVDAVSWGDSYVLIRDAQQFDPPDLLSPVRLAPHEGWSAALVTLPIAFDRNAADWLQARCGLRLTDGKRQWGILYPPPVRVDGNGDIELNEDAEITLGFVELAEPSEPAASLLIQAGREQHDQALRGGTTHLFSVSRKGAEANMPLHLRWGSKGLPSLVRSPQQDGLLQALPAVVLQLRRADGDVRVALHQSDARDLLEDVRGGRADLVAVTVPYGVTGQLRQRLSGKMWQEILLLTPPVPSQRFGMWSLSAAQLEAVAHGVRDRGVDIDLFFGSFGRYFAPALAPAVNPKATIPAEVRRSLLWYCRANGVFRRAGDTDASDDALIGVVRRTGPPRHLTGHRNRLLRQLARWHGAAS